MAVPPELIKGSTTPIRSIDPKLGAAPSEANLRDGLRKAGLSAGQSGGATGLFPPQGESPNPQTINVMPNGAPGSVAPGSYFNFGNQQPLLTNAATGFFGAQGEMPAPASAFDPTGGNFPGLPTGPNGQNFNSNGSTQINPYVPGTFANTDNSLLPYSLPQAKIPPLTAAQFQQRYLPGMSSAFSFLGDSLPATFAYYWNLSVGDMESRIGQFILPRQIICDGIERGYNPGVDFDLEEREMDFNAREFYDWGWMVLRYRPVMTISQINLVYPTGQQILNFPPSWIKPQMLSGQVRLVPPQGALSQIVLGPGGYLVMLIGGMFTDMPALLFVDYVAGMWPIPDLLIHAIAMQTAIHFFTLASDVLSQGQLRTVASLEGVVDEQREYTADSEKFAFAARIKQYEKEINRIVTQWIRWSGGTTKLVIL